MDEFKLGEQLGKLEARLDKLEEKLEEEYWWECEWGTEIKRRELIELILDHLGIIPKLVLKAKEQKPTGE